VNLDQNPLPSESQEPTRNAAWWIGAIPALLFAGSELAALWASGSSHLWWIILPIFIACPLAYLLIRTERRNLGNVIWMGAIGLQSILLSLVQRGSSLPNAITAMALITAIGLGTLPRRSMLYVLLGGLISSFASVFIDQYGNPGRPAAMFMEGRWIFSIVMLALFGVFLARQLSSLDIRTKIVAGILGTGALTVAVLSIFVFNQTQQITGLLSTRLDASVSKLAEQQLKNTAAEQARLIDQSFQDVMQEVSSLAQTWTALQVQKEVVSRRTYWDASTSLRQWDGGQYGNSADEPSSVFVPKGVPIDEALIKDLNTSAYLDFFAPKTLEMYPTLLAVYTIDTRGVLRYYPNIDLASQLPSDFDGTSRPYYRLVVPFVNPERLPRWAAPYDDATGAGVVVSVAAPVYQGDEFMGIVAADMQLAGLEEHIDQIRVGQTGYAFMLDDAGQILALPQKGHGLFGFDAANGQASFGQSVLGLGSIDLQAAMLRMVAGEIGFQIVDVGGVETYVSFAPIQANGYSIGLVVPVAELQGSSIAAHKQTNQQIASASRTAALILILLLLTAIAVSLGLGQIIAAPIQRLTQVATQIAAGDLSVQAPAVTRDEIGTLAKSFNTMTSRLQQTLDGLEQMVEERTAELLAANERNERRAKQFESIAQVARTVSSTRDIDTLLTQITTVISREFRFYHVGIFLLDAAKEYAILSAANSQGGQDMLKRGHRLKVGETGIVGYVTGTGKARVALDVGADAVFFNSPDLPDTRSEIALPLRAGEEIIGALDVQSTESGAFTQEDISILSTLVDQVSVAIQNARQFEETRKALREAEALAKQFAQTGWQQYTRDKNLVGIHHTGAKATLLYGKNGKDKEEEPRSTDPSRTKSRGAFLSLPIELRGEVIGSVDVRSPDNRPWDQDELDIVTAIVERSAIAMENARLLEESQRLASKEAKIGAVTARISASINMRNVLQTAVEELGRALPGSEVMIQFQTDQNKNKTTS
jgi:GAF domain-containing protein/HAMP domain-containing protein